MERAGRVLVVDDLPSNRALLARCLEHDRYTVQFAADGARALECVKRDPPDIVLMDVMMPGVSGIDACRSLKQDPATRLVPVVLITAAVDGDSRLRGIDAGADDFLSKPINPTELRARVRSLMRIKRYTDDLDTAEAVIVMLALTIEARDPCTEGHCQRMAASASAFGSAIGLSADDLQLLHRGAFLHDIGKIGVPDAVLLKPGKLTDDEFATMKSHTLIGDEICSQSRLLSRIRPIVRHHHERRDGSGYPDGLRGDDIPLLAQIIGIVDVFDALMSPRPYKPAATLRQAHDQLRAEGARGWHRADLLEEFIRVTLDPRFSEIARVPGPEAHAIPSRLATVPQPRRLLDSWLRLIDTSLDFKGEML
jgi:putative two-component system response regulator